MSISWQWSIPLVGLSFVSIWLTLFWRARSFRVPVAMRPMETRASGSVRGVRFPAIDGTQLDGWLFYPNQPHPPIVLMAPGLGGTKDGFLESFAWAFVEQGMAALVFDYRCFGGSDGIPRHWVDPRRHREDYEAALKYVQVELAINGKADPSRVALWGSSFSGGTVLTLAAQNSGLRAIVAQCPYLRTPPELEPRGINLLRFVFWTTLDMIRLFPPIYIPLFGRPGEWVFAPSKENPSKSDFYGSLGSEFWRKLPKPALGGWQNRMLARVLADIDAFVPMQQISKINCPILFIAGRNDDMVPQRFVEEAFASALSPHKHLLILDCGHFDLYFGQSHEENRNQQARFLVNHLNPSTQ